ncbi:uncharacterized protein [Nicotiana tomentosiformis]|uniref:uncharacterized protein n=1 Tax=Nicotiana tomentosiformis TaxID=4098 RepID=UPI00388C3BFC
MRDFPKLMRGEPPQISQTLPVPQGLQTSQAMITVPVATPPAPPARGGEQLVQVYIRAIVMLHGIPMDGQSERTIQILEYMLRACVMDFRDAWDLFLPLAEFAYNNNYRSSIHMAPYEALYGRRFQSLVGWFEPGEARLFDIDLVQDALERVKLIHDRLHTTQSRQKSYADQKVRDVAFMKYHCDPSHMLNFSSVQLDKDLSYVEEPVAILDRQVRKLRWKSIASVNVQWRGHPDKEATWDIEHDMRNHYPHLFTTLGMSRYSLED